MRIVGVERVPADQLKFEIERGGRFVVYPYCISVLIMSFKRSSNIYFVPAGETSLPRGLGFSAVSLVLGWWGIPWGPIWTVSSILTNLQGGRDVTREVVASLARAPES